MPLPELVQLEELLGRLTKHGHARSERLAEVQVGAERFPIWSLALGACDKAAPSLALVGGVHGLERIGTQVVLTYLRTLEARLGWDRVLQDVLKRVRVLFVPLLNPGGMWLARRANPRGVDLMRNAPWSAEGRGTLGLGGQRLSRHLPWYAGAAEAGLELESQALVRAVSEHLLPSRVALSVDCHSGFGMRDRLWFPYARTRKPFPHLAQVVGLKQLLDRTLPHHIYRMEPQASAYTIQGDLWDHLHDLGCMRAPDSVFVPLTLEMGSWSWVRKNPRQIWTRDGSFNPVLPHRRERTLRRHMPLFDFLLHAVASGEAWALPSEEVRARCEHEAFTTWGL